MVTYTSNRGLSLPTVGGDLNAWGTELNVSTAILDQILGSIVTISVAGNANVTVTSSQAQYLSQKLTGALTGNIDIIFPAAGGFYIVNNATTGAYTITAITSAMGSAGIAIPQGQAMLVFSDATNIYPATGSSAGAQTLAGLLTLANGITVAGASAVPLQGYLGGLTLSNDGAAPNTVLDVAAGIATDSTNLVSIVLAAFTKSTGGSWTAGSGTNGMGVGLTVANSTWYHVFAIINAGTADVYFDTSITAANKPASTTAFRRIGSFKTDASAHILAFRQFYDTFIWAAAPVDYNGSISVYPSTQSISLSVPPGVNVTAEVVLQLIDSAEASSVAVYSPYGTGAANVATQVAMDSGNGQVTLVTNTARQVNAFSTSATGTLTVNTVGWRDSLGR